MNGSQNQKNPSSKIKGFILGCGQYDDLKKCILQFASINALKAGVLISAVGSLEHITYICQSTSGTIGKGFSEIYR
jgi:hypothetical protein